MAFGLAKKFVSLIKPGLKNLGKHYLGNKVMFTCLFACLMTLLYFIIADMFQEINDLMFYNKYNILSHICISLSWGEG